ncbi:MAG: MATE family efflux transporter [Spirochaetia bacterium]|jgi:putative MATE family efflux protein|nr:MATE family efflux transporter [Spirochaetia bacterium]
MTRKIKANLTEGNITKLLIRLTLPMMAGMISMIIFNLVDTFYIGQLGKNELAAMSFTFPVVMIVQSIALGLGMGTSSVVSRAIGKGDSSKVRRLSTDALFLAAIIVAVAAITGELTIEPLFTLMGADSVTLPLIKEYMRIWYIGVIFVVFPMVGNNIIRATGDMKTPALLMAFAAIANMILDPFLIFGIGPFPAMGLAGGALATVIGRAFTLIFSLTILIKRELISIKKISLGELFISWKQILFIGIPAALTNIITPLTMGVITRMVSSFGTAAVAGFGVATRLEMIVLMIVHSLASVMVPFTGQNWGKGNIARVSEAVIKGFKFSLIWSVIAFGGFMFTGSFMAGLFNKDPVVITTVVSYLRIIALTYGFQGMLLLASSVLNAMGKPFHAILLSLFRLLGLYIPLALLGSNIFGLSGIFAGGAIANFLTGILAAVVIIKMIGKSLKQETIDLQ